MTMGLPTIYVSLSVVMVTPAASAAGSMVQSMARVRIAVAMRFFI